MDRKKKIFASAAALFLCGMLVMGFNFEKLFKNTEDEKKDVQAIGSFEDCAGAGYPVMESYPRQCAVPDGPTYIEVLEEPVGSGLRLTIDEAQGYCENKMAGQPRIMCVGYWAYDSETDTCSFTCGGMPGEPAPPVEPENPVGPSPPVEPYPPVEPARPIGGERDEHGCLEPAGYSYSQKIGACVREWELDESQRKAAEIARDYVGETPTTIIGVETARCPGCFTVKVRQNNLQSTILLRDSQVAGQTR